MQRLLPPKLVLVLVLGALALRMLAPPGPELPLAVRLLGLLPLVAGVVLNVRSAGMFHRIGTNIKTFDDPGTIVDTGPFSFSRNPMYLGFTTMLVGVAMLIGTAAGASAPIGFWLAAQYWYIPFEEARMRKRFGADYEAYCARVSRWAGRRSVPVADQAVSA